MGGLVIGVYQSGELEQEGSKRTINGVYISGELEDEGYHWCLYE